MKKYRNSYRQDLERCRLHKNYFECINGLLNIRTQTLLLSCFFIKSVRVGFMLKYASIVRVNYEFIEIYGNRPEQNHTE